MFIFTRSFAKRTLIKNTVTVHRLCANKNYFNEKLCERRQYVTGISLIDRKDDKTFLQRKNYPDVFGTLSPMVLDNDEEDEGDRIEEEYSKYPPNKFQKKTIEDYAIVIKNHLKNQKLKEAIDVFEIEMKNDRVKPERYIFNLLIGGCAKAGYTKKSFQLYNKMKQCGLTPNEATYTSLFNACANSPFIGEGLKKANHLREIMLEKGYEPNTKNYNAMIKAYGRCGDIKTAFELVDIMSAKNVPISKETFNFLLQACISDKDFGFRHALLVWHKLYQKGMKPDIYSFNLLLKCTKECNLGDVEATEQVLEQIVGGYQLNDTMYLKSGNDSSLRIESGKDNIVTENKFSDLVEPLHQNTAPNLLSNRPHLGSLVRLSEITECQDRLLLLGGVSGFLQEMDLNKVRPSLKTFTALLEVAPPTKAIEKIILSQIRKRSIKCDVDFFNILIKKRSMRFDYDGAREVVAMIETTKIRADIVTYGVLALGCTTLEQAQTLLSEMNAKGIRPNNEILGTLLKHGCLARDFMYVTKILHIIESHKLKPNVIFLKHLSKFDEICEKIANSIHHPILKQNKNFRKEYVDFKEALRTWQSNLGFQNSSLKEAMEEVRDEHPWEQFKTVQTDGFEVLKNSKVRHKSKYVRFIKNIKLDEFKNTSDNDGITPITNL